MADDALRARSIGAAPYPWLHSTWARLLQYTEQERLPHAIMLVGPRGTGLQQLATAMGEYLICPAPINGHACGQCKACGLLQAESHPDLRAIGAESVGKSIKIDQIRAVTEFSTTTSQQGGRRVILISPAEAMNRNAANALLKGLEEPGENCVYILVSESPAQVLPTIRSRCRRIEVPLPDRNVAVEWLSRQGIADAERLLVEAGGGPILVTQWVEQKLYAQRDLMMQTVARVMQEQLSETAAAKTLAGYDPVWVIDQLQSLLIAAVKRLSAPAAPIPVDGALANALGAWEPQSLCQLFDAASQRKQWLLSSANPNVELLMTDLLLEFRGNRLR